MEIFYKQDSSAFKFQAFFSERFAHGHLPLSFGAFRTLFTSSEKRRKKSEATKFVRTGVKMENKTTFCCSHSFLESSIIKIAK